MTTQSTVLLGVTSDIAAALGGDWRSKPGEYDHFCLLVRTDGLTLWVRTDPNKPGRLLIRCDTADTLDIHGHRITYSSGDVPAITVSATRAPGAIAGDIRSRLLPGANEWHAQATHWKQKADGQRAFVEDMRNQLLTLPGAHLGYEGQRVYGPQWGCELNSDTVTLTFRSLPYSEALRLLHTHAQTKEEPMPGPMQDHMFPGGDDLPLFSEAPVKVSVRPFNPKPHAAQPSLLNLRPTFGGEEPTYQATQPALCGQEENQP